MYSNSDETSMYVYTVTDEISMYACLYGNSDEVSIYSNSVKSAQSMGTKVGTKLKRIKCIWGEGVRRRQIKVTTAA